MRPVRLAAVGTVAGAAVLLAVVVPTVRSSAGPGGAGPRSAGPGGAGPRSAGPGGDAGSGRCDAEVLRPECSGVPQYDYENVFGHRVAVVRPRIVVDVRRGPDGAWGTERVAVPGPCAYYRVWTGAWMYDWPAPEVIRRAFPDAHDAFIDYPPRYLGRIVLPNGIGSIEPDTDQSGDDAYGHIGSSLGVTFDQVAAHRGDDIGYWWIYECSIERYAGLKAYPPERIRQKFLQWHAQVPTWQFWRPGQENPPDIPPDPDLVLLILQGAVNPLAVEFAPKPPQSIVNLLTWVWVADSSRGPVEIRVTGGGRTITGRATADPLRLAGAAPPTVDAGRLRCADSGVRYPAGGHLPDSATDCGLGFRAATPRGAAGPTLRFTQRWTLTLDGVAVPPPAGIVDRTSPPYRFDVHETQVEVGTH